MADILHLAAPVDDETGALTASGAYQLFEAYVMAGFTRVEALELVKAVIVAGLGGAA